MELDLDHIERIAKQRQEAGGRVTARPEVIIAMVSRIRELESASQPGGGEAVGMSAQQAFNVARSHALNVDWYTWQIAWQYAKG